MAYTKIAYKNKHYVLLVRDANGKYKQVFKNKLKSLVNKKRVEIQSDSIDAQAAIHKKTFVQVYEEFANQRMADAENPNSALKVTSVNCYPRWFNKWIRPVFENKTLFPSSILVGDLSVDHATTWFKAIRDQGCTFKVACDVAQSLTTCLKFAVRKQYIKYVGALGEWSPKTDKALLPKDRSEYIPTKTVMINRQEVARLLNHLVPSNSDDIKAIQKYVCVSTLAFLGLRMSELIGLRWSSIDLEAGRWEVTHTIVNGQFDKSVKADASERNNLLPNYLWKVLKAWKVVHNKHFGKNVDWIFPSFSYYNVAMTEKAVRDWLHLAYQDLGLAKVEVRRSKSADAKLYLKVVWCKFKGGPSKTFRHFASTALMNYQKADPITLNDNFIKGFIGHKNLKMTRHYADHNNLDEETLGHDDQARSAIDKAIQIETTDSWKVVN